MSRHFSRIRIVVGLGLLLAGGCAPTQPFYFGEKTDLSHYIGMATKIETPDVKQASLAETADPPPPLSLSNSKFVIWDLSLQDAIHITLQNSKVMRTLGGRFSTTGGTRPQVGDPSTVLETSPSSVETVYEPALAESNPTLGVEGALSAFDAQLASSFTWAHTDVPQNVAPAYAGIFPRVEIEDVDTFNASITKRTESGGTASVTTTAIYTDSNSQSLELAHDNSLAVNFGFTQRLLRGGGSLFNQIHGPLDATTSGIGGGFSGVMIARINDDMALNDFESNMTNLLTDVENAYWELYYAYRALDAGKVGRDSALVTWRKVYALYVAKAKGGEADKEAQARDQYYQFRGQVEQALVDLYRMENRLRFLMGLAATDGRLIRPINEPTTAKVLFDWCDVHSEALARSVYLRKEKWHIKQLELELIASRNLLLPNLDFVGNYELYGLGDNLLNSTYAPYNGLPTQTIIGSNAGSTLADGQFGNWNVGLNFSVPIGLRKELTTIRNQQLQLVRERCMLQDQELELSHDITDAVRNVDVQYRLMQTNFNRRLASEDEVAADQVAYDAGTTTLDILLQAEQERSVAEAAYYRSLIDYNRAISQVHYVKGSLPEYDNVFMAEGPWPGKAYFDARRLARSRDAGIQLNYGYTRPDVFSRGEYPQFGPTAQANETHGTPTPAAAGASGEPIDTPQPVPSVLPGPNGAGGPNTGRTPSSVVPGRSASIEGRSADAAAAGLRPLPASARTPRELPGDGPQLGNATGSSNRTASANGDLNYPSSRRTPASSNVSSGVESPGWKSKTSDESDSDPAPAETNRTAAGWQGAQHPLAGQ
ncbi:MAG TPA: TolC family protein [Pirellulales bacterium]|jgi:outer membrane protein TolC|nr:TolC family protein [Pirellulales bacterium]